MRTKLIWFVVAAVLATLGFSVVLSTQGRLDAERADAMRAATIAKAVAWMMVEEYRRDEDLTQRFLVDAKSALPQLRSALVLKGAKIVASTDERAGERLDPDSLADKALYDAGARLKAAVRKNEEARERETANVVPALEIEEVEGGRAVFVPVVDDGRYRALVNVVVDRQPPSPPVAWWLFGVGLIVVLLFTPLARARPRLVGSALLVVMVSMQALALEGWRNDVRHASAAHEAETLGYLASAGLYRGASAEGRRQLVASLDRTPAGLASNRLLEVRTASVAASAEGVDFDVKGFVATFAPDYFVGAGETDRKNLFGWAAAFGVLALLLFNLGLAGQVAGGWRSVVKHRGAYAYLSPAMLGMGVLVFVPVVFGIVLGFLNRRYNAFEFAGLSNYLAILSDFDFTNPTNFYFTLGVTAMWTVTNVSLHVAIGLFLAILLNDKMLAARGLFRVVLIVPWAVPNYITALVWKGMFHRQFGAINVALEAIGLEGVSWFQSFWPSFFTNLSTNVWLGFPFMMVVSLGALQSIPTDLYEAAIVDGASRWQRFANITLPLLKPALVPAVIVGTVWTFNSFNIIYLVSEGQPNGATDILITEAFRWAFERDRYGYAAAYSTLIFAILLVFTVLTNRFTKATKGAYE